MSAHEDRAKVLSAFGGTKGLVDSGIPSIFFLVAFNITHHLHAALFASIATSAVLTIIRLIKRDTLQHALSGLIGVLICAWFANRTGNPSDVYIPKLLTNLGYGTVYLIGNLAGWPILGLMLGPIVGENLHWRKVPERKKPIFVPAGSGCLCSLQELLCSIQFTEAEMSIFLAPLI